MKPFDQWAEELADSINKKQQEVQVAVPESLTTEDFVSQLQVPDYYTEVDTTFVGVSSLGPTANSGGCTPQIDKEALNEAYGPLGNVATFTTQYHGTFSDKISVKALCEQVEDAIAEAMTMQFDFNRAIAYDSIKDSLRKLIDLPKGTRLDEFKVVCDETNNPKVDLDQGILKADIIIIKRTKPDKIDY